MNNDNEYNHIKFYKLDKIKKFNNWTKYLFVKNVYVGTKYLVNYILYKIKVSNNII